MMARRWSATSRTRPSTPTACSSRMRSAGTTGPSCQAPATTTRTWSRSSPRSSCAALPAPAMPRLPTSTTRTRSGTACRPSLASPTPSTTTTPGMASTPRVSARRRPSRCTAASKTPVKATVSKAIQGWNRKRAKATRRAFAATSTLATSMWRCSTTSTATSSTKMPCSRRTWATPSRPTTSSTPPSRVPSSRAA
ncbi:hypothetical protein D3C79_723960 [compost metagenome]